MSIEDWQLKNSDGLVQRYVRIDQLKRDSLTTPGAPGEALLFQQHYLIWKAMGLMNDLVNTGLGN